MGQQKTVDEKVLRLRQLRRAREWTQAELGGKVGLSAASINGLESGRQNPSFEKALEIAALFDLPAEEVFAWVSREVSA